MCSAGLWYHDGVVSDIICDACDDIHAVEIIPLPKGGYGWFCSNTGRYYAADNNTVARGVWRYEVIAARLADALDIPEKELKDAGGGIWHLGRPSIKGVRERAFFMLCLQSTQDIEAVNAAIIKLSRPAQDIGIVLTCSDTLPAVYRLEQGYRIIPLADVLAINEDGAFIIAEHDIAAYFPDVEGVKPKKPGRPSKKEKCMQVIAYLKERGIPVTKSQINSGYAIVYPGEDIAGRSTIKTCIKAHKDAAIDA